MFPLFVAVGAGLGVWFISEYWKSLDPPTLQDEINQETLGSKPALVKSSEVLSQSFITLDPANMPVVDFAPIARLPQKNLLLVLMYCKSVIFALKKSKILTYNVFKEQASDANAFFSEAEEWSNAGQELGGYVGPVGSLVGQVVGGLLGAISGLLTILSRMQTFSSQKDDIDYFWSEMQDVLGSPPNGFFHVYNHFVSDYRTQFNPDPTREFDSIAWTRSFLFFTNKLQNIKYLNKQNQPIAPFKLSNKRILFWSKEKALLAWESGDIGLLWEVPGMAGGNYKAVFDGATRSKANRKARKIFRWDLACNASLLFAPENLQKANLKFDYTITGYKDLTGQMVSEQDPSSRVGYGSKSAFVAGYYKALQSRSKNPYMLASFSALDLRRWYQYSYVPTEASTFKYTLNSVYPILRISVQPWKWTVNTSSIYSRDTTASSWPYFNLWMDAERSQLVTA